VDDVENRVDSMESRVDQLIQVLHSTHLQQGGTTETSPVFRLLPPPPAEGTVLSEVPSTSSPQTPQKPVMDHHDLYAFKEYTTTDACIQINPPLREYANGTIDVLPYYTLDLKRKIEVALSKLDNYVGTVYRGVDMSEAWIENLKQTFKHNSRAKVPFSDPAFLSASTKLDASFKWLNCRMVIQSKTGKEISEYSEHPLEFEVLFATGTQFVITDIVDLDKKLLVRMHEV
jgi:hypothetical protein